MPALHYLIRCTGCCALMLCGTSNCCGATDEPDPASVEAEHPATTTAATSGSAFRVPESQNANEHAAPQDPLLLRQRANAPYQGVPIQTRVTQRFEMYSPRTEAAVRELKAMGFTQVMLDRPNLHQAAADNEMAFVVAHWWNQETKPEDITAAVERARQMNRSLLVGFSIMDEPERNSPDTPFGYYIDVYEQLKPQFQQEFPATRLEISHWGPLENWTDQHYEYFSFLYEAADVMRIMPYPDLREGPLDDVFYMMRRTRRLMDLAGRELPLVVILQTWILPPENKLPEIPELRVMAYQAMLSGAETVSFFDHNPEVWRQTPGFEQGFRNLLKEVTAFAHRYRDWSVESEITGSGVLTSTLTSPTGSQIRLQVNTQRTAVNDLAGLEIRQTVVHTTSPCPPILASTSNCGISGQAATTPLLSQCAGQVVHSCQSGTVRWLPRRCRVNRNSRRNDCR